MPQYTYTHSDPNTEQPNCVDEHVLILTLLWTSYYHFSNPLALPLISTPQEIERNKRDLFRLTTGLTPRQFTRVGYKKLLKTFSAPRANEYSMEYFNHNIIRPNQDQFLDGNQFASPQLPKKSLLT